MMVDPPNHYLDLKSLLITTITTNKTITTTTTMMLDPLSGNHGSDWIKDLLKFYLQ